MMSDRTVQPAKVVSNREIAAGAFILQFRRSFKFLPGQVIGLCSGKMDAPRLYSIASSDSDELLDILYTIKQDGFLTPRLAKLRPGSTVYHTAPFGKFLCHDQSAIWIASGTGIAPFASMTFSGLSDNKLLIYGNTSPGRLYFHDRLLKFLSENYIPCCSRENTPGFFHGRVTDYLISLGKVDTSLPYYLCGSAEMVVDVRDILISKGVPFNKIMAEIFF